MFMDAKAENVRHQMKAETEADAVLIEDTEDVRVVRLVYHPVEERYEPVRTPFGIGIKKAPSRERELTEEECRRKFARYRPDRVHKVGWDYGGQYEVHLVYEEYED